MFIAPQLGTNMETVPNSMESTIKTNTSNVPVSCNYFEKHRITYSEIARVGKY